jgi:isoleucyl-tRNA synthetase
MQRPDLAGTVARHPMHALGGFFAEPRPLLRRFRHHRSGTGLVHMAPDHGEDDFELCKAHGIEPSSPSPPMASIAKTGAGWPARAA